MSVLTDEELRAVAGGYKDLTGDSTAHPRTAAGYKDPTGDDAAPRPIGYAP